MVSTPFNFMCTLMMAMSTMMAVSSSNWLFMWASMELNLLSFIPLIMLSNSNQETEASIKYFMAQALGSSVMLMSSVSLWFSNTIPMNFMSIVLTMSIILKMGMAPCHLWYPSVMTSISWTSCLLLSTWQKLAPLSILCFILSKSSSMLLLSISALNAIIGGMMGMNQTHLRTIMAYSSITHMGWMSSLAAMNKLIPTMVYFSIYSMMILPIFMMFHSTSMNTNTNMNSLVAKAPLTQIMFPVLILSLGGLPPMTGFIPKLMVLEMLSQLNPYILLMLVLGAMMNLYFYMNMAFNMILSPMLSMPPTHPLSCTTGKSVVMISFVLLSFFPIFVLMYAMIMLN